MAEPPPYRTCKLRQDVTEVIAAVQEAAEIATVSDTVAVMALAYLRSHPDVAAKILRRIHVEEREEVQKIVRFRAKR
jgi:aryl-alcohol dehydrogenase-like predicted oxidoreductase